MAVKVLIVEDNPVARSFLCRVVRESFSDTLTITEAEVDRVVDTIVEILAEYTELKSLVADVGQRLGTQALSGWSF